MRSFRLSLAALLALTPLGAARAQSLDSLALRLGAMSAVTGLEDAMADTLLAMLPGAMRDRAGNVVLTRGSGSPVRMAVCGMDEIGYVVGNINAEGYLTLRRVGTNTSIGPLYDQFLEGQRVTIFGRHGPVPGVVGVRSTHLTRGRPTDGDPPFSLDNAWVDVGASTAAEARQLGIAVLSPVTRAKVVHRYGPGDSLLAAPWMAQRAACAALLGAAQGLNPAGGTAVVAFTARWQFARDGLAYLTSAHPGATVTVAQLAGRYEHTPVETVALSDVRALEARLANWLTSGAGTP